MDRRADGQACGLQASSTIVCPGQSTCAAVVAPADNRLYAGCYAGTEPIVTTCDDLNTPCTGECPMTPGVLTCAGRLNCATRHWVQRPATDEFDRPYATEYFCNSGFAQVTATYMPVDFPWQTVLAADFPTTIMRSGVVSGPTAASSSPVPVGSGSSGNTVGGSSGNTSAGPSAGVIAGAAVGGAFGLFAILGLVWVWCIRRPAMRPAHRGYSQGVEEAKPVSNPPPSYGNGGETLGHASGHQGLLAPEKTHADQRPPTAEYTYTPSGRGEQADTLGGLPTSDELRRLRPGAQFATARGAPSVMTDLSETLTVGDADEIDDIHVIGHGR